MKKKIPIGIMAAALVLVTVPATAQVKKIPATPAAADKALFHDSHFHLTNYVQEGITAKFYVDSIMGSTVGRSTLFGIPLQQQWSHRVTGEFAPSYYLDT